MGLHPSCFRGDRSLEFFRHPEIDRVALKLFSKTSSGAQFGIRGRFCNRYRRSRNSRSGRNVPRLLFRLVRQAGVRVSEIAATQIFASQRRSGVRP